MSAFDDDLHDDLDDAFDPAFDAIEDENNGDATVETEGEVHCPWCGEPNTVALDPGSGSSQEYVEDCQVCCRPWVVHVTYDEDGRAEVWAEAQGDWDD
jgi:transposase-like protein